MKTKWYGWQLAVGGLMCVALSGAVRADDKMPTIPDGTEVTMKGALVCNGTCMVVNDKPEDHVPVLVAVDGSPEVAAIVKKVLDDNYPDKGLDADAAQKLDEAFNSQLKWFIDTANSPPLPKDVDKKYGTKNHYCHAAAPYSITGTVTTKDGKKWIKVSKYTPLGWQGIKYPEKFMMADKPFAMPDKEPLVLKINDSLTIKCIKVPAGKVYMGEPMFVATRYLEQFPHMVTLTKPVYIAEIPVTQEVWEAVMGSNPSKEKNAQFPVQDPSTADIEKFCTTLSEKTKRTVRLPTAAEWIYIVRSGTSNPGFAAKYADQGVMKGGKMQPVKSKKPNAWGFYDLISGWWEVTGDREKYPSHQPETDPYYPVGADGRHTLLGEAGENWTVTLREFEQYSGYSSKKFRIAVEADPAKDPKPK